MADLLKSVDAERIRSDLRHLSRLPHLAGSKRDAELAKWVSSGWRESGLDRVEEEEYEVYLTWPDRERPNKIHVVDDKGNVQFTTSHMVR